MENILSIIGIVVSTIALIVSLWLFNLSLDNSRKVLLNKIDYYITYDHEILTLFSHLTINGTVSGAQVAEKDIRKFVQGLFGLDRLLNDIQYSTKGIPGVSEACKPNESGKYDLIYDINPTYQGLKDYFKNRKLPSFMLMLDYYDGRLSFINFYHQTIRYRRRFFIGPIIGYDIKYKRNRKCYKNGKEQIKLKKFIKNEKDYKKFYENVFLKANLEFNGDKKPFERKFNTITVIKEQPTINFYR